MINYAPFRFFYLFFFSFFLLVNHYTIMELFFFYKVLRADSDASPGSRGSLGPAEERGSRILEE